MSSLRIFYLCIFITLFIISGLMAGNMYGLVQDAETGEVIAGVRIMALTYSVNGDSLSFSAQSGSDGRYQITNMAAYAYTVWCEHPDFLPQKMQNVVVSENASLMLNFNLARHNHPLYDTKISGHIYGTGEMLPAFWAIAGAKIILMNEYHHFETRSDDQGQYLFRNIPPGNYKLLAAAMDYQRYEHPDIIILKEGNYIDNLDIQLIQIPYPSTSVIHGTVVNSADNTPVYPAYITVIPLYYTMIDGPIPVEPDIYAVMNNPDGSYVVENIPATDYLIICSAETYKWQRIEKIQLKDEKVRIDFFLDALDPSTDNLITGTVYAYPTRARILSLVDVYLSLIDPGLERPEIIYHSLTDGFGHYQFFNVNPGLAEIRFSKWGFEPLLDTLDVTENTWLIQQDYWLKPFNLTEPIVLGGFVYDAEEPGSSVPVYPAHILLYTINSAGEQIRYNTVNNPDGSYQISGIRQGTYTVVCTAVGYEKQVERNVVLSDPEHTMDFHLKPLLPGLYGHISGQVLYDKLNTPVSGAHICFHPRYTDLAENDAAYHTTTGTDGRYKIMLPAGEYIISCQFRGEDGWYFYREFYDDVHTISGATAVELNGGDIVENIDFGIPYQDIVSYVIIKGNVSDNEGNALSGAVVNIRPYDMPARAYGTADYVTPVITDSLGNYEVKFDFYWFTFPSPVLGFVVSAHKSGYITEFYQEKTTPYEADILWAFCDTTFQNIDFTLEPQNQIYAIQGMVSSEAGTMIPQAFVIGIHAQSGEVAFGISNNDGTYTIAGLKRGFYFVLFVASGYCPEFYDDARIWEEAKPVWVNGLVTGIDAVLSPMPLFSGNINGLISGRILDETGNPLAGAMVTMQMRDGPVHAYSLSDRDGMFEIPWETEGEYLIRISKVNYSSASAWIKVGAEDSPTTNISFNLESTFTDLPDTPDADKQNIPTTHRLYQNYPNPFNPVTNILFDLPETEDTKLVIYDILGHRVWELFLESLPAGKHTVTWNGRDQQGNAVSSGIYFYVIQTPAVRLVGKMILQK